MAFPSIGTDQVGANPGISTPALLLQRLDQLRPVEPGVVDEEPHLVVRERLGRHARADELGHLARIDQPAVEPCALRALREHEGRALVDLPQQPGGLRRDDRAGAQRVARLRILPVRHQSREAEERSVGASDEVRLLRALDLARRRIDALDRLPFVPAFRRNEAARAAPRVAPHRLPGRLLHARDEARLGRLRLLPPVRHEAPAAGGELELLRVRGPADERDRVGGKDVEAAREGIRVAVPADVPEARDRLFLGAGEAAAHPAYSKAPGTAARNAGSLRSENSDSTQVAAKSGRYARLFRTTAYW